MLEQAEPKIWINVKKKLFLETPAIRLSRFPILLG